MASSSSSANSPLLPMHNNSGNASRLPHRPPPLRSNTNTGTQRQPPVTITIRFASVALSDLVIELRNPHSTTVSALKALIRSSRPEDTARRRLRLIYGGKVLADHGVVGEIVGLPRFLSSLPPPPPPRRKENEKDKGEGVGEAAAEEEEEEEEDADFEELRQHAATARRSRLNKGKSKASGAEEEAAVVPTKNVYIHCSVGEELDDARLAEEAVTESQAAHQPSTLPAPQGFDRLLSANFTEADIAALRSQFHGSLVNTASASASMSSDPSAPGASLNLLDEESRRQALAREERWIDESVSTANGDVGVGGDAGGGVFGGTGGGGGGLTTSNSTGLGGYEDFLVGLMWGFFWPVCVVWIFREEVMSQRKYVAVAVGVLANLFFGVLRVSA